MAVLKQAVSSHAGNILNDYGDGSLCAFDSATEAVRCAIEVQQQLQTEPKVPLRIGLHIGEIFFEEGKPFGDGVNVASRIQSLGIANSILISAEINNKLKNQPEFKTVSLGRFYFKNVDEPIEVFALANEGLTVPDKNKLEGKLREKKRHTENGSCHSRSCYYWLFPGWSMKMFSTLPGSQKEIKQLLFCLLKTWACATRKNIFQMVSHRIL